MSRSDHNMDPNTDVDSWTTIQKLKHPNTPGRLRLKLELDTMEDSECLTELYVIIKWAPEGQKEFVKIGLIEAWVVDKAVRSESGEKLWIADFASLEDSHPFVGLRDLNNEFFDSAGRRRPRYKALASELSCNRYLFVNKIHLEKGYRSSGLGTHALKTFHAQLRSLSEDLDIAKSTVFLQPEYLGDGEVPTDKVRARTQQQLLRFYSRNGYAVYFREHPELLATEGTYMLMGRKLAANANEQESEKESSDKEDTDDGYQTDGEETESTKNASDDAESAEDVGDAMSLDRSEELQDDDDVDGEAMSDD